MRFSPVENLVERLVERYGSSYFKNSIFGPYRFAGPEALSSPPKSPLPATADSGNRGNRFWKSQKIIKVDLISPDSQL
jgi:hypothetical protein